MVLACMSEERESDVGSHAIITLPQPKGLFLSGVQNFRKAAMLELGATL